MSLDDLADTVIHISGAIIAAFIAIAVVVIITAAGFEIYRHCIADDDHSPIQLEATK